MFLISNRLYLNLYRTHVIIDVPFTHFSEEQKSLCIIRAITPFEKLKNNPK